MKEHVRQLRVAVDVRFLQTARTGTHTSMTELCARFRSLEDDELRFFFIDSLLPVYGASNKLLKLVEHARLQLWKQVMLPLRAALHRCNIVFCNDYFVPWIHLGF